MQSGDSLLQVLVPLFNDGDFVVEIFVECSSFLEKAKKSYCQVKPPRKDQVQLAPLSEAFSCVWLKSIFTEKHNYFQKREMEAFQDLEALKACYGASGKCFAFGVKIRLGKTVVPLDLTFT